MIAILSVNSPMNTRIIALFLLLSLGACNSNEDAPDVSGIKIQLTQQHFEHDFFAIDTNQLDQSILALDKKYPGFTTVFLSNILALMPASESSDLKSFYSAYLPLYKQSTSIFKEQKKQAQKIEQGFQYLKHYFPSYQLPNKTRQTQSFLLSDALKGELKKLGNLDLTKPDTFEAIVPI